MPSLKIAAVGPIEIIQGFKAFGVEVFDVKNSAQAAQKIRELKEAAKEDPAKSFSIIIVVEELLEDLSGQEYQKLLATEALPAIILVPGIKSDGKKSLAKLKKLTEKAIGFDLLGDKAE